MRFEVARIERELTEVRARQSALELDLLTQRSLLRLFDPGAAFVAVAPGEPDTIRGMVSQVLASRGAEMGITEMIGEIAVRYGRSTVRTSVSPVLRKMERAGEVDHVGNKWILKGKGPSAGTDDPSRDDDAPAPMRRRRVMMG